MAYSTCVLKNTSGSVLELHVYQFPVDGAYEVPDDERDGWAENSDVLLALANGQIEVQDGSGVAVGDLAMQTHYLLSLEMSVRIAHADETLGTQEKAFPDYTGYPYFANGDCGGLAPAGQTTKWYLGFDKVVKIGGGGVHVGESCVVGDTLCMEMTYGVDGPVVGVFLDTLRPISVSGGFRWERRDSRDYKDIPIGIYLRLSYASTGGEDVPVTAWFDLRRTPDA